MSAQGVGVQVTGTAANQNCSTLSADAPKELKAGPTQVEEALDPPPPTQPVLPSQTPSSLISNVGQRKIYWTPHNAKRLRSSSILNTSIIILFELRRQLTQINF